MIELVLFYLATTGIHAVYALVITFSLYCDIPFSALFENYYRRAPANRGAKRSGTAQNVQKVDSGFKSYLKKCYIVVSVVQIAIVVLFILALQFEVPLPFLPNVTDILPPEKWTDLLIFVNATNIILYIPYIPLLLALALRVRLPHMPSSPKRGAPPNSEILGWKRNSEHLASISLRRLETSEKTFIYATCHKVGSRKVINSVLIQGKEPEAPTEFYLYNKHNQFLKRQISAPISVRELEEILNVDNY